VFEVSQTLQVQRTPVYWLGGRRHLGGMTIIRAYLRNSGTWAKMWSEMHNSAN